MSFRRPFRTVGFVGEDQPLWETDSRFYRIVRWLGVEVAVAGGGAPGGRRPTTLGGFGRFEKYRGGRDEVFLWGQSSGLFRIDGGQDVVVADAAHPEADDRQHDDRQQSTPYHVGWF